MEILCQLTQHSIDLVHEFNLKRQWADIKGYEGLYEVSRSGIVKGLDRKVKLRCSFTFKKGVIMKPFINHSGYIRVCLSKNSKQKKYSVHRLVAQAFIDNPMNKPVVNHRNGIKSDNRVSNLEWMTQKENDAHARSTGLTKQKGEEHGCAKLTEKEIKCIREVYQKKKYTQTKIAYLFNISQTHVSDIVTKKAWSHI